MGLAFEFAAEKALAKISASSIDDNKGKVWAAKVTYTGDKAADRQWVTDLFVEARTGDVTRFGAQLVCQHDSKDTAFEPSRPRLVRDVIEKLAAEADATQLSNDFIEVNEDGVEELVDLLCLPERRLPVVVVSTDDDYGAQFELAKLASRISGTAHLRSLKIEPSFELTRLVGKKLSTFNGGARIYLTGLDSQHDDPYRHPLWLPPKSGWNPNAGREIAKKVLPLGFRDSESGTRFWRLGLLRQAASRAAADAINQEGEAKQSAEIEALKLELANTMEEKETAESLMDEEAAKIDVLESEKALLKEENYSLRQTVESLQSGANAASIAINEHDIYNLYEGEPSLETSLNIISSIFPNRVVVLPTAIESARDSAIFKHKRKAFQMLWDLSTSYYSSLLNGKGDVDARKCFGNSYAPKEKDTISREGKQRRIFSYKGQSIEMMKHLKIGTAGNKTETLRIHFEWISTEGKLVIGHCGAHLNF